MAMLAFVIACALCFAAGRWTGFRHGVRWTLKGLPAWLVLSVGAAHFARDRVEREREGN